MVIQHEKLPLAAFSWQLQPRTCSVARHSIKVKLKSDFWSELLVPPSTPCLHKQGPARCGNLERCRAFACLKRAETAGADAATALQGKYL